VNGPNFSKDITDNEVFRTEEGEVVTAHLVEKPFNPYDPHAPVVHILAINNATVTTADLAATNGVVHILDSVLMLPNFPPPGNYTFPYNGAQSKVTEDTAAAAEYGGAADRKMLGGPGCDPTCFICISGQCL